MTPKRVTGYKTAKTRKKPSVPVRYLVNSGLLDLKGKVLDYGCGKGYDAEHYMLDKYDPYYYPDKAKILDQYDTIICNYVLNVVDETTQVQILDDIYNMLRQGGAAYITVRRDIPITGQNGLDCFQRYVVLNTQVIKENKSFCIYKISKECPYCEALNSGNKMLCKECANGKYKIILSNDITQQLNLYED